MIQNIYIEEEVRHHPKTLEILARYPKATITECQHYGAVFNSTAQNFRLQKIQPSLILAKKENRRVLKTPDGYGVGGNHNYYFSHMLNCLYDCRYCFLQGMYRSAHYVVFVNYEDFIDDIKTTSEQHMQPSWFFSGYDCDSLAMEPVTGFMDFALSEFADLPNTWLEIRTKSTQIRSLLEREPLDNCVVAYSFTPDEIAKQHEHKVPSVAKRILAARRLQDHGWKVGIRLDPLIDTPSFQQDYAALVEQLFTRLNANEVHSVSYGSFRLPRDFFKKIIKLYPKESLFAADLTENDPMVSYPPDKEQLQRQFVSDQLTRHIDESRIFPCDIS